MRLLSPKGKLYAKMFVSIVLLLGMIWLLVFLLTCGFERKQRDQELMGKMEALILINQDHPLPSNYHTTLVSYHDIFVSEKMRISLEAMIKDSCTEGICLSCKNGYQTKEKIQNFELSFEEKTSQHYQEGSVALLEHASALAIDFYREKEEAYNQKMWAWLEENAYRYGFILRYPKGKETLTNQTYLPWHYRFVGIKHAKIIQEEKLSLEEYLSKYQKEGI